MSEKMPETVWITTETDDGDIWSIDGEDFGIHKSEYIRKDLAIPISELEEVVKKNLQEISNFRQAQIQCEEQEQWNKAGNYQQKIDMRKFVIGELLPLEPDTLQALIDEHKPKEVGD